MVAATTLIGPAAETFERLFAREYRRVVSIAYRITADAGEAEDVAQEVFVRLARSPRLPDEASPYWLYRAAAHAALNAVRARKRRALRERREFLLVQSLRTAGEHSADPQALLQREQGRAAVRAALLRLNARDAEVLALRYGGLSYAELAGVLQIPPAQVGMRLARAERAFKKEIERDTSR